MININDMKLSEIAEVERLSKTPITSLADNDEPRGLILQALVYIYNKRSNPQYTFAEAGDVSMSEATELLVGDDEADDDDKSELLG